MAAISSQAIRVDLLNGDLNQFESNQKQITNLTKNLQDFDNNSNHYRNKKIFNVAKIVGVVALGVITLGLGIKLLGPYLFKANGGGYTKYDYGQGGRDMVALLAAGGVIAGVSAVISNAYSEIKRSSVSDQARLQQLTQENSLIEGEVKQNVYSPLNSRIEQLQENIRQKNIDRARCSKYVDFNGVDSMRDDLSQLRQLKEKIDQLGMRPEVVEAARPGFFTRLWS